jgi:hypothetical protein
MKNIIRAAVICGLLTAGVAQTYAQTTNSEVTLNVALTGFQQASVFDQNTNANPVKATGAINSKSIIKALSGATNVTIAQVVNTNTTPPTTNNVAATNIVKAFAANAKLMLFSQHNAAPIVFVREVGRTNVDTDVSAFFPRLMTTTKVGVPAGKVEYDVLDFTFDNNKGGTNEVYLGVDGFMTINKATLKSKTLGTVTNALSNFSATMAGSAGFGVNHAVVKGTISGTGPMLNKK